jgi:predicted Abi (CAAX) family protease
MSIQGDICLPYWTQNLPVAAPILLKIKGRDLECSLPFLWASKDWRLIVIVVALLFAIGVMISFNAAALIVEQSKRRT